MRALQQLLADESGGVLVEYGLVTATLGFTCLVSFFALANVVNADFLTMANSFTSFETGTWP